MVARAGRPARRQVRHCDFWRSEDRRVLPCAVEAPFFEFYLKGKPGFDLKDTASFRTGENQWHRYDVWPPKTGFHAERAYLAADEKRELYRADGRVWEEGGGVCGGPGRSGAVPASAGAVDVWRGSTWRTWLVEDQRFVSDRKDLANFETPVLTGDLTVTGDVKADLFAATTGTDTDWIVKLIDVYPDGTAVDAGYQLMVAEEILRGRYRNSFTKPEPVKPGEVERVQVEPAWGRPHVPQGASDDGGGAVELVSAV